MLLYTYRASSTHMLMMRRRTDAKEFVKIVNDLAGNERARRE